MSRLQQVVDIVDSTRVLPKSYWCTKIEQDANGNQCFTMADYRDTTIELWDPSPVLAKLKIDAFMNPISKPYLVAPFDFLNQPNATLVFMVSPQTEYWEYWKNYPRRRVIPDERSKSETQDMIVNGSEISNRP